MKTRTQDVCEGSLSLERTNRFTSGEPSTIPPSLMGSFNFQDLLQPAAGLSFEGLDGERVRIPRMNKANSLPYKVANEQLHYERGDYKVP